MPSTLFDSAGLAIVAYANVDGASGSTTRASVTALANSGITTTRITTGTYQAFLPTGLTQSDTKDLIFVQPKAVPSTTAIQLGCAVVANVVEESATVKQVKLTGVSGTLATTAIDSDFNILILRTILP
jgi:hypothetical protein